MVGNPAWLDAAREGLQLAQVVAANRIGRANRHRDAMHHKRIACANAVEDFEWTPARDHEVFRKNLEPVDFRMTIENMQVVVASEPDAEAEKWKIAAFHAGPHQVM